MILFGRQVMLTTLNPYPPKFPRTVPGWIVVNRVELTGLRHGNGEVFKHLAAIAKAADFHEALIPRRKR